MTDTKNIDRVCSPSERKKTVIACLKRIHPCDKHTMKEQIMIKLVVRLWYAVMLLPLPFI